MTVDRLIQLQWNPERIIKVQWQYEGRTLEISHPNGMDAHVLRTRDALAISAGHGPDLPHTMLPIVNADGTTRLSVSNVQPIHGVLKTGSFRWFEDFSSDPPGSFSVVFDAEPEHYLWRLNINAQTGEVLGVSETR